jgi:hypothetical protein
LNPTNPNSLSAHLSNLREKEEGCGNSPHSLSPVD